MSASNFAGDYISGQYSQAGALYGAQQWPYSQQWTPQGFADQYAKLLNGQANNLPGSLSTMATYSGSKPLVVCNGVVYEEDTIEKARAAAERLAHQHQADAFILKPITKVSPKREVVTTPID